MFPFRIFALVLLGTAAQATPEAASAPSELEEFQDAFARVVARSAPAVVKVKSANTYGSGVLISPGGLVLTNRRIATQSMPISPSVLLEDGTIVPATVLKIDLNHDIALLKIEKEGLPWLAIAPEDPEPGRWVAVVGKAFYRDTGKDMTSITKISLADSNTVTLGTVNARDTPANPDGKRPYKGVALFIDALINPGCEGGAVIDTAGRLVGIVGHLQPDARTWDELDFAAPASVLTALIRESEQKLPPPCEIASPPLWNTLSSEFCAAAARVLPNLARIRIQWTHSEYLPLPDKGGPGPFTGVFIDGEGHILTSASHFPEDRTIDQIEVECAGGGRSLAKLLGRDRRTDLALLKAESLGAAIPAEFADARQVRVGQFAVAVSTSFDPADAPAFHVGIVSAVDRLHEAIQTDAALTLGNRGGPLVDLEGRVLGIMTQLQRQADRAAEQKNGVAFAVPYATMTPALARMKKGKSIVLPYVGMGFDSGQNEAGCLVTTVKKDGPAGKAGVQEADLILSCDGYRVLNPVQFQKRFQTHLPGDTVMLKIERVQKKKTVTLEIPVVLGEASGH